MFESIQIENYRKINKLKIEDLKQFNFVVGKNCCGKTSILESLFLSINPGNAVLTTRVRPVTQLPLTEIRLEYSKLWRTFFHKLNPKLEINLRSKFIEPFQEERSLTIKPIFEKKIIADMGSTKETTTLDNFTAEKLKKIIGVTHFFTIKNDKGKTNQYKSEIRIREIDYSKLYPGIPIDPFEHDNDPSYDCSTNGRLINPTNIFDGLGKKFSKVVINKQKEPIIDILKKIDPELKDLTLIEDEIYADLGKSYKQLLNTKVWGEGVLKTLALLIDLNNAPNLIILIDEIENGLHYSSMEILFNSLFQLARKFNNQLIMATHSYECIKAAVKSISNLKEEDNFRLFRIESRDDEFKAIKHNFESTLNYINKEWEIR